VEIFKFWSFLQPKSVNIVSKLLQLLGKFVPYIPWVTAPKWKFLALPLTEGAAVHASLRPHVLPSWPVPPLYQWVLLHTTQWWREGGKGDICYRWHLAGAFETRKFKNPENVGPMVCNFYVRKAQVSRSRTKNQDSGLWHCEGWIATTNVDPGGTEPRTATILTWCSLNWSPAVLVQKLRMDILVLTKITKVVLPDLLPCVQIHPNAFAAGASTPTSLGKLRALPRPPSWSWRSLLGG